MDSRSGFRAVCLLVLIAILVGREAQADRLDLIQKRGTLIVGVKSDYPPFGMRDTHGRLVGFEPDLAAELARRLGVSLQLLAVTSTNRLQRLEEGAVDVVIATLGDSPQRRQIATLVEPGYYASGATVVAPPTPRLSSWMDLRGKKVCATQGAYFNRPMAQRFLLDLQIFNGTRDARLALRDGRCVAWLYDDTSIAGLLADPESANYQTPLPSMMISPWAIALSAKEQGSRLEQMISGMVADWHRSGWLIEMEKRWGIKPSHYLLEMRDLWSRRNPDGGLLCTRLDNGQWPAACRHKLLLRSDEVGGIEHLGLLLKEQTGLNVTIIHDAYDRTLFLQGLWITLQLMAACISGSLIVGCLGALAAESGLPGMRAGVRLSAALGRMTPPLLLIYLVFFRRRPHHRQSFRLDFRRRFDRHRLSFDLYRLRHRVRPARSSLRTQGAETRLPARLAGAAAGATPGLRSGSRFAGERRESDRYGERHRRTGTGFGRHRHRCRTRQSRGDDECADDHLLPVGDHCRPDLQLSGTEDSESWPALKSLPCC
ncbi:transporter substrate-binding domain-containing protein [Candidatus Accumulibacter phosphatis]|uniref:Transporter substrate-binding domain-containing protein n=1 Tax=Candidatus Accumulibacter contiguus TaxID=2954381 RepID=A0ABX1TAE5_9PROT|nr:transporter substrate-binding domain-containing protein [Candidatus Accumulibacter contiguus]NMQ05373.1 transporter substrate-binding domain-containing protein [Candidatus Accumulibacter contiguus]